MNLLAFVGFLLLVGACAPVATAPDAAMKKEIPAADAMMQKLPDQIFAAHFVDAAPKHGDTLTKLPEQIVINFNFTLSEPSTIAATKDDKPVELGKVVLASNKLSMASPLPGNLGDGFYVVKYKACWPDKSCHDGLFAFKVASAK